MNWLDESGLLNRSVSAIDAQNGNGNPTYSALIGQSVHNIACSLRLIRPRLKENKKKLMTEVKLKISSVAVMCPERGRDSANEMGGSSRLDVDLFLGKPF